MPLLVAGLGVMLVGPVTAQTFRTLQNFSGGSDGANPSSLVSSEETLFGTTAGYNERTATPGGICSNGTLFRIEKDGTGFTNLHVFSSGLGSFPNITNTEGVWPMALALASNTLYGAASGGGIFGHGTIFKLNTDGTGFTNLHSFAASDGISPNSLILSGRSLYGVASRGGSGNGSVFRIDIDGTGFTNIHSFTGGDGNYPNGVILSGNVFYGTATTGGRGTTGTVFKGNLDGTGFGVLYEFTPDSHISPFGNSDGALPEGSLVLLGNTLFGTTAYGGSSGAGTLFSVNSDGTGFRSLYTFTGPRNGAHPAGGLILSGNTLYGVGSGMTPGNSNPTNSTLFKFNANSTSFTTYHFFGVVFGPLSTNSDGASPSGLILSGNTLYGTAGEGGNYGKGTVFSLSLPPPRLATVGSGGNVILTWPNDTGGFTLQASTNLASPVWSTNSPPPGVVNGQNTVTNPISSTQQFFRLSQ